MIFLNSEIVKCTIVIKRRSNETKQPDIQAGDDPIQDISGLLYILEKQSLRLNTAVFWYNRRMAVDSRAKFYSLKKDFKFAFCAPFPHRLQRDDAFPQKTMERRCDVSNRTKPSLGYVAKL